MQSGTPRPRRANRTSLVTASPTTPSRTSQQSAGFSQQARASPSSSTLGNRPRQNPSGPTHFPLTLLRNPLSTNTGGMLTQSPWHLPPLDVSTAMLLTAIAMEMEGNDPSPTSSPHVGLYWSKSEHRINFFDYVVTVINKLCKLLDGVTDSIIVVEAISADDKTRQMRYTSRVIDAIPQGENAAASISAQVIGLAAQVYNTSFKGQRRTQFDSEREKLTDWAGNGNFLPAKWADAPLAIRFDHGLVDVIRAALHDHATQIPPSPFLASRTIPFVTSPTIWFKPVRALAITPTPAASVGDAEVPFDEYNDPDDEDGEEQEQEQEQEQEEEWVPFARYKSLREIIPGAWCTRFDIAPEAADGVRVMLYEEQPQDWEMYLKKYFKVGSKTAREMVNELQSYIDQM